MGGNLVKSGTHQIALTGETYDRIITNSVTTELLQQPLAAEETQIFQVVVQSSNANAVGSYVYVGSTLGCFVELVPGGSITIPVNDLQKVCVRGSVAGLVVNYLAVR